MSEVKILGNEAEDIDALLAENRRLKEELVRLNKPQKHDTLFRPPWQPDVSSRPFRRSRVSCDAEASVQLPDSILIQLAEQDTPGRQASVQLPAVTPSHSSHPPLRKSMVSQSMPSLNQRSTSSTAELRKCLLSAGASQAFEQLDVNRNGRLNFHDFLQAVESFGEAFEPSLLVEVFGTLSEDGHLSIEKLLDMHPLERSSGPKIQKMDTQSLFKQYKHRSSGHRRLNRQPRWHEAERRSDDDYHGYQETLRRRRDLRHRRLNRQPRWHEAERRSDDDYHGYQETLRRRRDLRKQFREDRQGIKTEQKRELVQGIQPLESFSGFREQEQRNMEVHWQRIQDAIKGCSRARYNLVEIQKQMADLIADHDDEKEVTIAFKDLFRSNLAKVEVEDSAARAPRFSLMPNPRRGKSVMIFGRLAALACKICRNELLGPNYWLVNSY